MTIEIAGGVSLELQQDFHRWLRRQNARALLEREFPRYLEPVFGFSVPVTAGSTTAYDVGGPSQGRIWEVTRAMGDVGPLGATRATGMTIYLMTAPGAQQGVAFSPGPQTPITTGVNIEWPFTSYPFAQSWGSRQFVCQYPEHVFVVVLQPSSGNTAHTVAGQVAVTDLPEHEYRKFAEVAF